MDTRNIQNERNIRNLRNKRAGQQQGIVSLSCIACLAFAVIWGFHGTSSANKAVKVHKTTNNSSSVVAIDTDTSSNSSEADSQADSSSIDESNVDDSSEVVHDDADDLADAVFIGDSRTVGLQNNCDRPKATFLCSVGMHIDTVMTDQNITLSNGNAGTVIDALGERQYGRIYINLGTNELGWPYIDTFKDYYTQLITKIQEIQPNAAIYAESILPVTAERSLQGDSINNTNVATFNQAISEVAAQMGINYLDCTGAVSDASGNLPAEASTDGIHLIGEYCDKWLGYIIDNT
ncbi:GDSL-type esterase/lipase family protein [Ruminococcus sp.]|uniref:GDSL-type esterase/lipase family protein n=1 Tax=Ruminococcus sp. TaxID=41978 RepID=UPI0025DCA3E5|nr:GDSL-type esterase/lipase family protein [Ruminococcus sp.]